MTSPTQREPLEGLAEYLMSRSQFVAEEELAVRMRQWASEVEAARSAAGKQEPVAWRTRMVWVDGRGEPSQWVYMENADHARSALEYNDNPTSDPDIKREAQALFTHPAPGASGGQAASDAEIGGLACNLFKRLGGTDAKWVESGSRRDQWTGAVNDLLRAFLVRHSVGAAASTPEREKVAPVQGWPAGIPWSLHLEAYAAYCKKWSAQPALIDLEGRNCRGGFSVDELDGFVPGWRERVSEIGQLRTALRELVALKRLHDAIEATEAKGTENFVYGMPLFAAKEEYAQRKAKVWPIAMALVEP